MIKITLNNNSRSLAPNAHVDAEKVKKIQKKGTD
jgi:hypothetical protein